jgi:hypothetical protein
MAMTSAVLVMSILGVLAIAIVTSAMGSLGVSKSRNSRVIGLPPADSAISAYQHALREDYANRENGYTIDATDMSQIVQPGDVVLTRSQVQAQFGKALADTKLDPAMVPPSKVGTMRETIGPNSYGYWQLYKVDAPDPASSATETSLNAYVRAWVSTGTGKFTTEPRLLRVEFRPGLFADYQLVTDAPITYMSGARLDGPIHSNGLYDGITDASSGISIWAAGAITCSADTVLTTAKGTIYAPCGKQQPNTGMNVDIMAVEDSFERMEAAARPARGAAMAKVWGAKPVGSAPWRVVLSGSTVTVDGSPVAVSSGTGLLFGSDVELSGAASVALSIAARNDRRGGAANIRLVGNTGSPDGAKNGAALAVMAQGDIVIGDPTNQCGVTSISGAFIAETGGVTVDPRWTTDLYQDSPPTCTKEIVIRASIASHHMPVFRWEWNDTPYYSGYTKRRYEWDRELAEQPPPFVPLTRRWEVVDWTDANVDCLSGTRTTDRDCA